MEAVDEIDMLDQISFKRAVSKCFLHYFGLKVENMLHPVALVAHFS